MLELVSKGLPKHEEQTQPHLSCADSGFQLPVAWFLCVGVVISHGGDIPVSHIFFGLLWLRSSYVALDYYFTVTCGLCCSPPTSSWFGCLTPVSGAPAARQGSERARKSWRTGWREQSLLLAPGKSQRRSYPCSSAVPPFCPRDSSSCLFGRQLVMASLSILSKTGYQCTWLPLSVMQ